MSVNPKEKKMLQEMWGDAEEGSGADMPDGTYQFKIVSARFHMTDKSKPTFKIKLKVVGGDEEYIDKEFETNDNLETKENMGWFKRKLRRLNITVTEDIDDIIDGTLADEMEGKVFEGQVKTKNDFLNVYVNRLVSESSGEETEGGKDKKKIEKEDEPEEKEDKKSSELSEGDSVTWGDGKEGEIVEILEDDGKARIKLEDDTVVRVKLDLLEKAGKASKKEEKSEEVEVPSPDDVEEMKAGKVREVLESLGFDDPADMKDPRGVLHAFAVLVDDPEAKLDLDELKPLADALEVEFEKDDSMKARLKMLSKAVQEKIEG